MAQPPANRHFFRLCKPARSGSPRLGRFDSCAAPFRPPAVGKAPKHRLERRTLNPHRRDTETKQGSGRAFRGLALVFLLTFVNLIGVIVTAAALGGLAPWSRWQFIGMFGVIEAASGLANVISPNIWRLPIAELQTSERTEVGLAGSALLLPHWGGLARSGAGLVCVALAAWQEGIGPASAALVPFVLALAWWVLAFSAVLARAGVARPDLDVVQFVVRWGGREREVTPISIGASVLQFLLSITTIPVVKLFPPSILYQPEIGPSSGALLLAVAVSVVLVPLVYVLWSGRVEARAAPEQQREAEEQS
jgi:hypothetical protein